MTGTNLLRMEENQRDIYWTILTLAKASFLNIMEAGRGNKDILK